MPQVRFGVSLDEDVLKTLDDFVIKNNFPNRSQGIRHLVETANVEENWKNNDIVSGAIVLLYDHHKSDIGAKMDDIQHFFYKEILATQHFHIDHDNCLEIVAVKGNADKLKVLASKLIALKGIVHGKIVTSKMI
ncbi:MAG: nickel-responsive transcriptional regulator NikR [Chryseobacterium sp.]|nr:MAG: nickel-responsive transcriptional regulator NikR [Chryseobacterium sp.]